MPTAVGDLDLLQRIYMRLNDSLISLSGLAPTTDSIMPNTEPLPLETSDLWADLREQTADFQAGVQEVYHELDAIRQSLADKEEALGFQSELVAEQQSRFTETAEHFESLRHEFAALIAAGNDSLNDDNNPLLDSIENHLARFDSQFKVALSSLELIPELSKREELLDSEIAQLRDDLSQAAAQYEASRAEQQELAEDFAAERERSARLEATLAATEQELTQQRKLVAEELATIRSEIERQKSPEATKLAESTGSEATESTDDASAKTTSPKRSRRRRKSR